MTQLDTQTYAYRRFGKESTIPLVFLQHFRGNLDNWDPALVDDIAAQREVILVDYSGVGLSTGTTPRTVQGARDVLALVDALGLKKVATCSVSRSAVLLHKISSCCDPA